MNTITFNPICPRCGKPYFRTGDSTDGPLLCTCQPYTQTIPVYPDVSALNRIADALERIADALEARCDTLAIDENLSDEEITTIANRLKEMGLK